MSAPPRAGQGASQPRVAVRHGSVGAPADRQFTSLPPAALPPTVTQGGMEVRSVELFPAGTVGTQPGPASTGALIGSAPVGSFSEPAPTSFLPIGTHVVQDHQEPYVVDTTAVPYHDVGYGYSTPYPGRTYSMQPNLSYRGSQVHMWLRIQRTLP